MANYKIIRDSYRDALAALRGQPIDPITGSYIDTLDGMYSQSKITGITTTASSPLGVEPNWYQSTGATLSLDPVPQTVAYDDAPVERPERDERSADELLVVNKRRRIDLG